MWQNCRRQVCSRFKDLFGKSSFLTRRQKILYSVRSAGIILFLSLFFYQSLSAAIILLPLGIVYLFRLQEKEKKRRQEKLRGQFKDAILGIAANLKAGYAVENSFRETLKEMKMLYGKESLIYRELYKIVQGLKNNLTVEYLMTCLAEDSGLEEIQEFADVFSIAKKSGGNLTEIIYETASVISDKIEVEKEIQVLISSKKLEQKIMTFVPFAIILYVGATSKGYFDILYSSPGGRVIMTVCLALYLTAYMMGEKITEIKV